MNYTAKPVPGEFQQARDRSHLTPEGDSLALGQWGSVSYKNAGHQRVQPSTSHQEETAAH